VGFEGCGPRRAGISDFSRDIKRPIKTGLWSLSENLWIGAGMCRTYGAQNYDWHRSQPFRAGLSCTAPPALRLCSERFAYPVCSSRLRIGDAWFVSCDS
jgi:hypothetical protein